MKKTENKVPRPGYAQGHLRTGKEKERSMPSVEKLMVAFEKNEK